MLAFLLVALVLVYTPPALDIDHRIKPYAEEVIKLSKNNLKGANPVLVKKLPTAIAYCYYTAIRYIQVDIKSFKRYTHKGKLAIIAHEMMHCEKSCDHDNKLLEDGCHSSLMHKEMQDNECYEKHWDRYVKEMQEIDC